MKPKTRSKIASGMRFLTLLLAGAILPLAFAPFEFWPAAFIAPAVLLYEWQKASTPKAAFMNGFFFGLGMYGVGVSWVFVSIHHFGNTNIPISLLLTGLLVLLFAVQMAAQGFILKRFFRGNNVLMIFLGFPCLWVLFEWFRSIFLSGFPWLLLGYSQFQTPLSAYAPILSVFGVSFAVVLSAAMLFAIFKERRRIKVISALVLVLVWGGGGAFQMKEWTAKEGDPKTVSLIQGNIPPLVKFSPHSFKISRKIYEDLTATAPKSDLIIWPEDAIPLPLPHSQPYVDSLEKFAQERKTTLITGIQSVEGADIFYNSLIAIGQGKGIYHKHHLLPFGDFLPFDSFLRGMINFFDIPASSFTAGASNQNLITAANLKLNPQICYEIAFPEQIRKTLRDAVAILTLSEDGWFGDSIGPHQHLEIARMRALETGRPVLRATTSGISAIIDHKGKIIAKAPQFEATVLSGSFEPRTGDTPWVKLGLWPLLIALFLGFLLPGRFKR